MADVVKWGASKRAATALSTPRVERCRRTPNRIRMSSRAHAWASGEVELLDRVKVPGERRREDVGPPMVVSNPEGLFLTALPGCGAPADAVRTAPTTLAESAADDPLPASRAAG